MKHLKRITHTAPARATVVEDIICTVARGLNAFFTLLGGQEPLVQFIEDKCSYTSETDS